MELPEVGQHCSNPYCKQLDFLPMKCDACEKIFCKDHIHYATHSCPESYRKDNQVPVCPLCNSPCPVKKGELPDIVVGRHIDNDCQSDRAKQRRKVYTNRCSVKSCKQKELVPVQCEKCHKNFCLRHRHEQDHNCRGFQDSGHYISHAGVAAINRAPQASTSKSSTSSLNNKKPPQQTPMSGLGRQLDSERRNRQSGSAQLHTNLMPGNMTEDEALRYAMQMSLNTTSEENGVEMSQQEQEDLMLARALAASEEEERLRSAHQGRVRALLSLHPIIFSRVL